MRTTNLLEQNAVLAVINHHGAASHERITSETALSPAEVSWALAVLENQGYVQFCAGPELYVGHE